MSDKVETVVSVLRSLSGCYAEVHISGEIKLLSAISPFMNTHEYNDLEELSFSISLRRYSLSDTS